MDEKDIEKRLDEISAKVDEVKKKMTDKWFLPVFITVLTAILGFSNFYIQKYFTNIEEDAKAKARGEVKIDEAKAFCKVGKSKLSAIHNAFNLYCEMQDSLVGAEVISLVAGLDTEIDHSTINNTNMAAVKNYNERVAISMFTIQEGNLTGSALKKEYKKTIPAYDSAKTAMENICEFQ